MSNGAAQIPSWVRVIVNILIAVVLVGSFLYLYIVGNYLAWTNQSSPNWPSQDSILELILTGVGGVMAAVFAVALNLPRSPIPRTLSGITRNISYLLGVVPSPPASEHGTRGAKKKGARPGGNGDDPWETINAKALLIFAVLLVLAYPILTFASVFTKLNYATVAPNFIVNFAGVGAGVLVGAFAVWLRPSR